MAAHFKSAFRVGHHLADGQVEFVQVKARRVAQRVNKAVIYGISVAQDAYVLSSRQAKFGGDIPWELFVDPADRRAGYMGQYMVQVGLWIDAIEFGADTQRVRL